MYSADVGCQNKSILAENVPSIITMKCVKYMQKDTFANGPNNGWPSINFEGSFLQPNIAAKIHKYIPIRKVTLNLLK